MDYVQDLMEDCLPQAFKGVISEMLFAIDAKIADSRGELGALTLVYDLLIKTNLCGEWVGDL